MMIPFKERSSVKQYIKSKPKPWGFKVWVLAGVSGYVYKFEMLQMSIMWFVRQFTVLQI